MKLYNMWPNVSRVHPCCSMNQCFIPFNGQTMFHCKARPHFVYSFTCWWTSSLLSLSAYCKQGGNEHSRTRIFLNICFQFFWNIPQSRIASFKHLPRGGIAESCGNSKVDLLDEPLIGFWMDSCVRIVSLPAASCSLIPSAHCQQKFIDAIP